MGEKLTAREEKYVQLLVEGKTQRVAYKGAFRCGRMKDKTIDEKASRCFSQDKIQTRFRELIKKHQDKAIMTRDELLNDLRTAFKIAMGIEATESIIKEITEDGEFLIQNKTIKKIDLKAVAMLADRISKLEGWDKVKDVTKEDKLDKYFEMLEGALNEPK